MPEEHREIAHPKQGHKEREAGKSRCEHHQDREGLKNHVIKCVKKVIVKCVISINKQSPDIADGENNVSKNDLDVDAGEQDMIVRHASNETTLDENVSGKRLIDVQVFEW